MGAPVLRALPDPGMRTHLFRELGLRFRGTAWIAIALLAATGVGNLYFRGLLRWELLSQLDFWSSSYGSHLAWKIALVISMLALQAAHDFGVGPRASRMDPTSTAAVALRRKAAWLARTNAVLGLVLLYVAVRLTRG